MKNVSLRQLRIFATVGKHLSFSRAAEELALTAPAVSMQIKDLEEQVGMLLFDRSNRTVSLTTVGEYLLAHARKVLAAMRDAEDMVANLRGLKGGTLDIVMASTATYFVPRLLAQFRKEHPQIEIRLQVAENRLQIAQVMQRGEAELAVMGRPPSEWASRAEPFAWNPLVLVTDIDHPFAKSGLVPPQALAREAFILREPGSSTREAIDEFMQAHHIRATAVMQMSSNEAIKQAVIAGMGVSLLSVHAIGLELRHGLLAAPEVQGLPVMHRWHLVRNAGKVLSPMAEAFRYYVLEEGEILLKKATLSN